MNIKEIKELIAQLENGKLTKIVVKRGDFELQLEKEPAYTQAAKTREVVVETESAFHSEASLKAERGSHRSEAPGTYVASPMVGTFYTSPGPEMPTFVKVGDRVDANTVVCIIEAMKVMNEVKAGVSGVVAEVMASNANPVEFGAPLFRIT